MLLQRLERAAESAAGPTIGCDMEPRIFCIPATQSSTVAVIRRGPTDWCHVGRWDPAAGTWQAGSWIRGTIYPQRCDLSPDGRWLSAFILKAGARWDAGATYISVSRLPWLTSLVAWGTDGTWTRGIAIVPKGSGRFAPGPPDQGDPAPLLAKFDLELRPPVTYAIERARGWMETGDSPAADPNDVWEIRRAPRITLEKRRPADSATRLLVRGRYFAYREGEPRSDGTQSEPAEYWIERDSAGDVRLLPGVQWADWASDGRLLVATTSGALEVRDEPAAPPSWHVDLARLQPDPQPPPPEASAW
jgi:hypothetical protein